MSEAVPVSRIQLCQAEAVLVEASYILEQIVADPQARGILAMLRLNSGRLEECIHQLKRARRKTGRALATHPPVAPVPVCPECGEEREAAGLCYRCACETGELVAWERAGGHDR